MTVRLQVRVEEADFSVAEEYAGMRQRLAGAAGAVATFVGLVRDVRPGSSGHEAVNTLHLEHYPGMTERSIEAIVHNAADRWHLLDVVVIHRVGALPPEAQIVYVQVAAGHRNGAFAACQFIMDYLKTDAVLWKREDTTDGERWLEATPSDRARISDWSADA